MTSWNDDLTLEEMLADSMIGLVRRADGINDAAFEDAWRMADERARPGTRAGGDAAVETAQSLPPSSTLALGRRRYVAKGPMILAAMAMCGSHCQW